jgi:hypothetical protein
MFELLPAVDVSVKGTSLYLQAEFIGNLELQMVVKAMPTAAGYRQL